jgi:hypothetical protein
VCLMHADAAYGFAAYTDGNGVPQSLPTVPYGNSTGGGTQINTLLGTAGRPTVANYGMYDLPARGAIDSGNYSLFAFGTATSTSVIQSALDMDNGTTRYFQFRLSSGKVDFIPFNTGGGATGQATSPVALSLAELSRGFTMGATAGPTRTACFQNGVVTVGGAVSNMVTPGIGVPLRVGARLNTAGAQQWSTGGLLLVIVWKRTLTDAEMQSLADNPWQLFQGRRRRMWMSPAAFAAYVLRVETASFLASVSDAVLTASRRLVGAVGALMTNWSPANLLASRRVTASAGAFAVTGNAASILAARTLAANVGTFGLTGAMAPMTVARRLAAQPGAFTLSPSAIQMVYTPAPGAGGPTYTLIASLGAFNVASNAGGLLARRLLPAASGTFVLAGTVAALLAGRRLPASGGAFAAAGAVAALCVTRRMPAEAGAFDLSGSDAQLRYSAQVVYARAPSGAGYAPQQHYNETRPAATSGSRPAATQRNSR